MSRLLLAVALVIALGVVASAEAVPRDLVQQSTLPTPAAAGAKNVLTIPEVMESG